MSPYKETEIEYSCSVFSTRESSCRYMKSIPEFRPDTETYSVNLRIQSKCVKIRFRKTPNMDTFWRYCTFVPPPYFIDDSGAEFHAD